MADKLVVRALLLREARRRGMAPDAAAVDKIVQGYESRYAANAQWLENRAKLLLPLRAHLGEESLLTQLEAAVRAGVVAAPEAGAAFYAANPAKFTEPEQLRVAVILFKVDPSAPTSQWVEVDTRLLAVAARARAGEDFGALARQYSNDASAKDGGDMGYLHVGMLPEGTQKALAALKSGEMTDSLRLLQGLAVFRLIDRRPAKLQPFDAVKGRAGELAQREQSERGWGAFVAGLRSQTPTRMDSARFLPLAAPVVAPLSEQAGARPAAQ